MQRAGLLGCSAVLVVASLVAASCGPDELTDDTLPPMATTTTTTTVFTTTTEAVLKIYVVQPGDLLGNIATAFNVSLDDLMALNGISNADLIQAGQNLKIPPNTVVIFDSLPSG